MAKTKIERIASVEDKIKQLEAQKKQLVQKQKQDERKARTSRLIQRGAILESFIPNPETLTNEQVKALLQQVFQRKLVQAKTATAQQDPASPALSGEGGGTTERA